MNVNMNMIEGATVENDSNSSSTNNANGDGEMQLSDFFGMYSSSTKQTPSHFIDTGGANSNIVQNINVSNTNSSHVNNILAGSDSLAAISSSSLLGDQVQVQHMNTNTNGDSTPISARNSQFTSNLAPVDKSANSNSHTDQRPLSKLFTHYSDTLHDLLCSQCPFCSDMIIRTVTAPLVDKNNEADKQLMDNLLLKAL